MILTREQIDAPNINGWCGYSDPQEASCCDVHDLFDTARAYHDLHDAVLLNASLSQLLAVIARLERGES